MTDRAVTLLGGTALLERAVGYTLGSLRLVTREAMTNPTPCRDWDLRALLAHMNDSLAALQEAADLGDIALGNIGLGNIGLGGPGEAADPRVDPVAALRDRACGIIGAWTREGGSEVLSVGGCPVPSDYVTGAGAIEVAVHGWDVAIACGHPRPIPRRLAEELLECCYVLVVSEDRPGRFAASVDVSPWSPAGDRLLAYLGRHPSSP
jgi:uncharacterized protein (TIGR03086 family)